MNFRRVWFPLLANPYPLPLFFGGVSVSVAPALAGLSAVWYSGGMVSGSRPVRVIYNNAANAFILRSAAFYCFNDKLIKNYIKMA